MLIPGFSNNPAAFQWGSRFFIGMNTQKFYSLKKKKCFKCHSYGYICS